MPRGIEQHHILQFTKNVELLLQQKQPKFKGLVTEGNYTGQAAQAVLQFGEVEMVALAKSDYKAETSWSEVDHHQRWVLPTPFVVSLPLARQNEVQLINSPKSTYAETVRAAYARTYDSIIIDAAIGDAKVGPYDAMTKEALPADQIIHKPANELSIDMLIETKEILDAAENDENEERFLALTSKQVSSLLKTTEMKSADYNTVKALVQGQLDTFLGFKFIRTERLLKNNSEPFYAKCFAWVKSGVHVGNWDSFTVRMDERADKNYVWQVYARAMLGATRTQEKKVVQINCLN